MLVEVSGPVVPPGEQPVLLVPLPEGVHQAPFHESGEGFALGVAHVRGADELGRVVDVAVFGRDVEVAAEGHPALGVAARLQMLAEPLHPRQLGLVVLAAHAAAVGDVHAAHAHPAAGRADEAALDDLVLLLPLEPRHHVVEAHTAEYGHAVPAPVAVMGGLVAEGGEGHGGEGPVGHGRYRRIRTQRRSAPRHLCPWWSYLRAPRWAGAAFVFAAAVAAFFPEGAFFGAACFLVTVPLAGVFWAAAAFFPDGAFFAAPAALPAAAAFFLAAGAFFFWTAGAFFFWTAAAFFLAGIILIHPIVVILFIRVRRPVGHRLFLLCYHPVGTLVSLSGLRTM